MPSNFIITGASGFIGAAVVETLLSKGKRVTALCRAESDMSRLSKLRGFETILYRDLQDPDLFHRLAGRASAVFIHCAWSGVGGQSRNEAYQVTENISLTLKSVELAAASGCSQWIGLGSQAEYGNQNRRLNEDAPLRPTTIYGKAKLAAGVASLALCEARKISGVWLRVFSTYGPGDSPNWFIPYIIKEIIGGRAPKLTNCEQLWDYLYVADAASAIVAVGDGATCGVFNLGSGSARPLRDYVDTILRDLGATVTPMYGAVPYRTDQVMHLEADVTLLSKLTKWQPTTGMSEGISATVAFERTRSNLLSS